MIIASDTYTCFPVKATFKNELPTPASEKVMGKARGAAEELQRGTAQVPWYSRRGPNMCSKLTGSKGM